MKRSLNTLVLLLIALALIVLLTLWLRAKPIKVDVATATRGPMMVTVDGEGKTRVRDRYVVASPIAGRLRRINLRRGDAVEQGQLIAVVEPMPLAPLDPRQRAEAVARVKATEDAKVEADRLTQRSQATYDQAIRERERSVALAQSGVISREEVERAQTAVVTSLRDYEAARSKSETVAHEVELARAALIAIDRGDKLDPGGSVKIYAPTSGKVLGVIEESERVVLPGAPLLELSNPSNLEVIIELLSSDAVKVSQGAQVLIEDWGGPMTLEARVRLVEPSAFTKVSALGIEEQRVNVIADFTETTPSLGDGYRVEAKVVIWANNDVLRVPISVLFRRGERWSLFVVENGVARVRDVVVGQRTPFAAEIKEGLEEGAKVVSYPSNQIGEGIRVEVSSEEDTRL